MNTRSRREFLAVGAGVVAATVGSTLSAQVNAGPDFEFALLGDTHFDRTAHHDHEWLARE